jgi:hypothetical protein
LLGKVCETHKGKKHKQGIKMNPYEYIRDDFAAGLALMDLDHHGGKLIGFDTETTGY